MVRAELICLSFLGNKKNVIELNVDYDAYISFIKTSETKDLNYPGNLRLFLSLSNQGLLHIIFYISPKEEQRGELGMSEI